MRLHAHAAGLCPLADPEWRQKLWTLGLWLFVPVLGWPAVLGYRARFVSHLFGPADSVLPRTSEGIVTFALEGLRAVGVIFGYLSPLYAALAFTAWERGFVPDVSNFALAGFFLLVPIFSTLSFPIACGLLSVGERALLSPFECALFMSAFTLIIFLVPAGFLEVSRTGKHRSAFAIWRSLPFVARNFAAYVEAWLSSGAMSLLGHSALPVAPWGVAWCYLAIIVSFNEVLLQAEPARPAEGFRRLLAEPSSQEGRLGLSKRLDARGELVTVLGCGWFSAPLPRWPRANAQTESVAAPNQRR